jgi:hypothetical protein
MPIGNSETILLKKWPGHGFLFFNPFIIRNIIKGGLNTKKTDKKRDWTLKDISITGGAVTDHVWTIRLH